MWESSPIPGHRPRPLRNAGFAEVHTSVSSVASRKKSFSFTLLSATWYPDRTSCVPVVVRRQATHFRHTSPLPENTRWGPEAAGWQQRAKPTAAPPMMGSPVHSQCRTAPTPDPQTQGKETSPTLTPHSELLPGKQVAFLGICELLQNTFCFQS